MLNNGVDTCRLIIRLHRAHTHTHINKHLSHPFQIIEVASVTFALHSQDYYYYYYCKHNITFYSYTLTEAMFVCKIFSACTSYASIEKVSPQVNHTTIEHSRALVLYLCARSMLLNWNTQKRHWSREEEEEDDDDDDDDEIAHLNLSSCSKMFVFVPLIQFHWIQFNPTLVNSIQFIPTGYILLQRFYPLNLS